MKWSLAIALCGALVLSAFVTVRAADSASDATSDDKPIKLVQPWNKLSSLSDEQKTKINEIHKKALADINQIRKQEQADIMALLSEEQKSELKSLKEKDAGDRKVKKSADEGAPAAESKKEPSEKADSDAKQ